MSSRCLCTNNIDRKDSYYPLAKCCASKAVFFPSHPQVHSFIKHLKKAHKQPQNFRARTLFRKYAQRILQSTSSHHQHGCKMSLSDALEVLFNIYERDKEDPHWTIEVFEILLSGFLNMSNRIEEKVQRTTVILIVRASLTKLCGRFLLLRHRFVQSIFDLFIKSYFHDNAYCKNVVFHMFVLIECMKKRHTKNRLRDIETHSIVETILSRIVFECPLTDVQLRKAAQMLSIDKKSCRPGFCECRIVYCDYCVRVESIWEQPFKKCADCKLAFYCCRDHQRHHWKKHKYLCRKSQRKHESFIGITDEEIVLKSRF